MILKRYGENVRRYRKEIGLLQKDLAEKIEVSINTISLLEQGKSLVSIPQLFEISEKLGVGIFDLFRGTNIVKTKAPKDFLDKYNQLNKTNKSIVDDILTAFVKHQRILKDSEEFNSNNKKTLKFKQDKREEDAQDEEVDKYIDRFYGTSYDNENDMQY